MPNGYKTKTTYEEREELKKNVMNEVNLYKAGKINRLTSCKELARFLGVVNSYITKLLKEIPESYRGYRYRVLHDLNTENTLNKQTKKDKKAYGKLGGIAKAGNGKKKKKSLVSKL